MKLTVNGQVKEVGEQLTLLELVNGYNKNLQTLVIELNGEVITREQWCEYQLRSGDKIELVTFVGGG